MRIMPLLENLNLKTVGKQLFLALGAFRFGETALRLLRAVIMSTPLPPSLRLPETQQKKAPAALGGPFQHHMSRTFPSYPTK